MQTTPTTLIIFLTKGCVTVGHYSFVTVTTHLLPFVAVALVGSLIRMVPQQLLDLSAEPLFLLVSHSPH